MPIDPKKLEAFAGGKGGRGGPPPAEMEEEPAEGEEMGDSEEAPQGIEKYAQLLQLMMEFQDDIEQCVDELDGEALLDAEVEMSPEDAQIMREGWDALDKRLKKEASKVLGGLTNEDAAQIADHLYAEDAVADPDKLEGWLMRVASTLVGGGEGPKSEPGEGEE